MLCLHHLLLPAQVFCELVKGLGESLVSGMVPGSSVAFAARKDNLDQPQTLSYASKSEGMFVRESLIFRCGPGRCVVGGQEGGCCGCTYVLVRWRTGGTKYWQLQCVKSTGMQYARS